MPFLVTDNDKLQEKKERTGGLVAPALIKEV